MIKLIIFPITVLIILSCNEQKQYNRQQIVNLLRSDDPDNIMDACDYIEVTNDTSFYKELLENPYKQIITHSKKHYGYNGYMGIMLTLKNLSRKSPPSKVTATPDSTIINFYRKLLLKRHY